MARPAKGDGMRADLVAAAVFIAAAVGFGIYAAIIGVYALAITSFVLAAAVGAVLWAAVRRP